jgi:hypothetical protein
MVNYISFLLCHKDVHFENIYISKMIDFYNRKAPRQAEVFINAKSNGNGAASAPMNNK